MQQSTRLTAKPSGARRQRSSKKLWYRAAGIGFWVSGYILRGSWDLVTGDIIKVTILIITYNPS